MKVLQVINSLKAGGAEKLLVDACGIYRQQGVKVDVLLLDGLKTDFYKKLKSFANINIYDLGIGNNVYSLKNVARAKKYLKGYDIVHVHLFPASYIVGFAKLTMRSTAKFIFTEHNTTNRRRNSKILKPLEGLIYKQYDVIVSISEAVDASLKAHLKRLAVPITMIKNGIDLKEIKNAKSYSKAELGFDENDILIMQVSSFSAQKDQETAIRALGLLGNNVKLLLVGEGQLRKSCEQLAEKLRVRDRVYFLGFRNDVTKLLKSVEIVILSSHFEGLSLASVEGLASSKPFIASDVPGLQDVVRGAGVLFKDGDEKGLSHEVKKLLGNRSVYEKTVESCLSRAQDYNIDRMVSEYIDLYNKL